MNYAPGTQISKARHIARSAQQRIRSKTGMTVSLMLYPIDGTLRKPEHMLHVIALALDMNPECFRMKTRVRSIVELRFLGALFLRMNFPNITLHQIAGLYGGQDHSSVLSGLARANNLIYTEDARFMAKYNTVLKSVNQWLRKEESDYASANSA